MREKVGRETNITEKYEKENKNRKVGGRIGF